jgi:antirestriction protein ArdC
LNLETRKADEKRRETENQPRYRITVTRRKGQARRFAPLRRVPGCEAQEAVIGPEYGKDSPMSKFRNASVRRDHCEELTKDIIAKLESGVMPWRKPWDAAKCASASSPMNPTTGRAYRGINALALAMSPHSFTSGDPRWCSYKQADGRGWQVRKGEKGTIVFFYKKLNIKDEDQEDRTIPLLRAYTVFHASQIDGIPEFVQPEATKPVIERITDVDMILQASGVRVEIGGDRAFYRQATDHIQMPPEQAFEDMPAWAATVIHELAHASGAKHRLDRDLTGRFGSSAYSREELRAELASLFVGNALDLPCDVPNHASYIESWVKVLKDDKREIFRAAADANRIAEWILSHHPRHAAGDDDQDAADDAQSSNGNASDKALAA